ncbi:YciI family protein [Nocardioides kribbensis]|uniref:YciI family protein n=1 Tax=Nocardioides kribbensis TaxID=305517 RepID=A0ABV1NW63_9ACTN
MPQFAVLIYSDDSAHEPGRTAKTSSEIATCDDHALELASRATMTAAWAFTPRASAKAVRGDTVTDGPYVDSPHVVAGVYLLEAPDLDAALATAATNPVLQQGGGLEVRPVHSGGLVEPPQA